MRALGEEFIGQVEEACFSALGDSLSVRKVKKKIGTWEVRDGWLGWVGLNTETRYGDGSMLVNPFVGVRYDPIHKLVARVDGSQYRRHSPPTISRFLGDLDQDAADGFEFVHGTPALDGARRLAAVVAGAGATYVEENCSLERLIQRIPLDCLWEDAGERLLAAMVLNGEPGAVIEREVERRLEEARSKPVNRERFRAFSQALLSLLREGSSLLR